MYCTTSCIGGKRNAAIQPTPINAQIIKPYEKDLKVLCLPVLYAVEIRNGEIRTARVKKPFGWVKQKAMRKSRLRVNMQIILCLVIWHFWNMVIIAAADAGTSAVETRFGNKG